jgi:hypothetical protein
MGSEFLSKSKTFLTKDSPPRLWSDRTDQAGRDALFLEFDGLSEQEVLRRVEAGIYDNRKSRYAREWLVHRDALHAEDNIRGLQARAQQAHDIARDSHRLVVEANSLAQASNSIAREAEKMAEKAVKDARASSMVAILALIVAALALGTAIIF